MGEVLGGLSRYYDLLLGDDELGGESGRSVSLLSRTPKACASWQFMEIRFAGR